MQHGSGIAFEITNMPEHIQIHKTFNVNEFQHCTIAKSQPQETLPPIRITKSGDVEQGLKAIREWKVDSNGKAQFRVQWEGQPEEEEWTW
jgi:hypothetical protein